MGGHESGIAGPVCHLAACCSGLPQLSTHICACGLLAGVTVLCFQELKDTEVKGLETLGMSPPSRS